MSKFIGFTYDEIIDALKSLKEGAGNNSEQTEIKEKISQLDNSIVKINETLGIINTSINKIDTNMSNMNETIGQIVGNVSGLDKTVSDVGTKVEQMDKSIVQINGNMSNLSDIVTQVNVKVGQLETNMTEMNETTGQIETNMSQMDETLSQVSSKTTQLDSNINSLETTCQTLQSDLTNLTDNVIPAMKKDIENAASGSDGGNTQVNWVTLYDMESTDAAINWGYPNGIGASKSFKPSPIDFRVYKVLRVTYRIGTDRHLFYFDISNLAEVKFKHMNIVTSSNGIGSTIISTSLYTYIDSSDVIAFVSLPIYKIVLTNSKYPAVTKETSTVYGCYKIEGLPF